MNLTKYFVFFCCTAFLIDCSQVASGSSEDEVSIAESSSSGREPISSSAKSNYNTSSSSDVQDEKCAGDSGTPWDGTTAKDFACGAGTKLSPYIILTAEQLAKLSFIVGSNDKEYQGKYYKLGADIILNDGKIIDEKGALAADSTKLHKWTPIGNSSVAFDGSFDGDDHTISGMFINTTSTHNGLFGQSSGTIEKLTVENSWVHGGKFTAGIVGRSTGSVENIENKASVESQDPCVGGVIGESYYKKYPVNSIIKDVVNKGIVTGKNNVGGIAGCATYVTVDNVENTASIEGYGYVGGVFGGIGSSNTNDVKKLKNSGVITGKHFVGGISGHCGGSNSVNSNTSSWGCWKTLMPVCGNFSNAENQGKINGYRYVGGVLGFACGASFSNSKNSAQIEGSFGVAGIIGSAAFTTSKNMYNRGDVLGEKYAGGIFSYNEEGVTSAAYSTGKVDGDSLVGLVIGYNYNTTMADYYYIEQGKQEPFGLNNGGGVATPKSEKEMKSSDFAELLGEDFVYDSGLNNGYPILNWEQEE